MRGGGRAPWTSHAPFHAMSQQDVLVMGARSSNTSSPAQRVESQHDRKRVRRRRADGRQTDGCMWNTANLRTKIMDFRGFDSNIILILSGGIPRPIGNLPESLSQAILGGIILVGRLGAWPRPRCALQALREAGVSDGGSQALGPSRLRRIRSSRDRRFRLFIQTNAGNFWDPRLFMRMYSSDLCSSTAEERRTSQAPAPQDEAQLCYMIVYNM